MTGLFFFSGRRLPASAPCLPHEMGKNDYCHLAAAGMLRCGVSIVARAAGQRHGGCSLGCDAGWGCLLAGDFSAAAQTHVGLRVRPRTDTRSLDLVTRWPRKKVQGLERGRPRGGDQEQLHNCTGALFFSALCRNCCPGFCRRALALELAQLPGLVSFVPGGGLRFSCDADLAYFEKRAV